MYAAVEFDPAPPFQQRREIHMRVSAFVGIAMLLLVGKLHAQVAQTPPPTEEGNAAEVALSDRSGQFRYFIPEHLGGVKSEINFGMFINENRDFVFSTELLIDTNLDLGPVSLRVGPQGYVALLGNTNRDDAVAVAFGGELRYEVLSNHSLAVVGSAFYAPSILSFGKTNNVTDFNARAEIKLVQNLILFAGYRWFTWNLTGESIERIQNAVTLGLRWQVY